MCSRKEDVNMKTYEVRLDMSVYLTIDASDERDLRNKYLELLKSKYKLIHYDISNVVTSEKKE